MNGRSASACVSVKAGLSLHPDGMAPRIRNLAQWRAHVLHWPAREARLSGDPGPAALHRELSPLPGGLDPRQPDRIAVRRRIRAGEDERSSSAP